MEKLNKPLAYRVEGQGTPASCVAPARSGWREKATVKLLSVPTKVQKFQAGAVAIGALAVGAVAIGALAIGALAIGRLVVGSLRLGKVKIGELEVDHLRVRKLEVIEKHTP